ncbi:hypothetical protein AC578_9946 [Pseudocercospora eumusae]|uniref:Uncharacterized protein n=1 Tax=Pseudocercospora eumusae TaxID=321146 RepID=A0A139H090_9PEZI|nr:hypothetical protein AC578_9946 [Pseudocercospora eumusae]
MPTPPSAPAPPCPPSITVLHERVQLYRAFVAQDRALREQQRVALSSSAATMSTKNKLASSVMLAASFGVEWEKMVWEMEDFIDLLEAMSGAIGAADGGGDGGGERRADLGGDVKHDGNMWRHFAAQFDAYEERQAECRLLEVVQRVREEWERGRRVKRMLDSARSLDRRT